MNFFEMVGQNILDVLQDREMSQTELADKMDVSKQVMSKIINGQKAINALEMKTIAGILNIDLEKLMENRSQDANIDESLILLMGKIENPESKETIRFLNTVIDELIFMEDLLHE